MDYQEYIDKLARERAQQLASTQKDTGKKAVAGAVQGFMKGGPVDAIIGAGKEIVKGAKEKGKNLRNSGKEMDSAMMQQNEAQNQELMQESDNQLAQNQQQLNNIVNNSNATPTFNGMYNNPIPQQVQNNLGQQFAFMKPSNYTQENMPVGDAEYADDLGKNMLGKQDYRALNKDAFQNGGVESNQKTNFIDKLASGLGDFQRGYQENRNTAFAPENMQSKQNIDDFKASINPEDYTTKLNDSEQAEFNKWANNMKAQGIINPNDNFQDYDMQGYWKNEVLNNTDLANGSAQNHFTDKYKMPNHETFSNESQYATGDNARYAGRWDGDRYIKPVSNNNMARLGEFAGTVGRAMQNPIAQGLLAGGISALTGNPNALATGLSYAKNRAMSNLYSDVLKQNGIDVPSNALTNITSSDMNKFADLKNAEAMNNYRIDRLNADIENKANELAWKKEKAEMDKLIKEQDLEIKKMNANSRATSANASVIRANNAGKKTSSGGKGGNTQKSDPISQTIADVVGGKNSTSPEDELRKRGYRLVNGKWTK